MADALTRARAILEALPLTKKQRDLYSRGMAAMDGAALERTTSKLESTLARAPETLAAARELLATQQSQTRKRAVILVENEKLRKILTSTLGEQMEIETTSFPEEAIQLIGRTVPDVVICDIHVPHMDDMATIRRIRAAAGHLPIFVLTANPEQDGLVAAAGATGYRAANAEKELSVAVSSAIKATASLSVKI
jgi:CheY-like chemotaxis protein